jgi:hypothetical protein
MNDPSNVIKISLNIEIPFAGGAPPRIEVCAAPPRVSGDMVTISTPTAAGCCITYDGTICAQGKATDGNSKPADAVFAKVYPGIYSTYPSTPVAEPSTSQAATVGTDGSWTIDSIDAGSGSGSRTLVVWAQFGTHYVPATVTFTPDSPGPYTECTYPEIASPAAIAAVRSFGRMPVTLLVDVHGFSGGAVEPLNRNWKIHLKDPSEQILYCSGGDGSSTPRVQLRCQNPLAPAWVLTFAVAGKCASYTIRSEEFDAHRSNAFHPSMTTGFAENEGIPATVVIKPA